MLFDGIARLFERVLDLVLPSLDDAGGDERTAGREKFTRERRERQDNIRNNVREHNVKIRPKRGAHPPVRENVPGVHAEAVRADAVERGVVHRHVRRFRVNVAADGLTAAEHERADGENAAAAAEIEHALVRRGERFNGLQTHARRGVAAGAEDEARIEPQRHAPVRGLFLPRGDDDELFPDGPMFYSGKRLGQFGKPFPMHKFRSMKVNAPDIRLSDGSTYNGDDDPRVTKLGKFLRKTSLDEIPQILNVLKGDMSLIGPRPDPLDWIDKYKEEEKVFLNVKPGITGYSQAYFRNSADAQEKIDTDVYYAKNISFLLDVKIFLRTIKTVICRENINVSEERK